jgi:hypothetical protein
MDEFSDGRRIFLRDKKPEASSIVGCAIVIVLVLGALALFAYRAGLLVQ